MSNATVKTAIANIGLLSIGEKTISSLSSGTVPAVKINAVFEKLVRDELSDDWFFNRKRVLLADLTQVYKLTVDLSPAPAAWSPGATLTGSSSGVTSEVIEALSSTVYLVTEPSLAGVATDYTDSEVISDGTNSLDCADGYPQSTTSLDHGSYQYGYLFPTEMVYYNRGISNRNYDKLKHPYAPEGRILFTNQTDGFINYNKWIGESGSTTVSDVTVMPDWFHNLVSARIAFVMSPNVTQNMREPAKAEKNYLAVYLIAKEHNGDQAYQPEAQGNLDWRDGANSILNAI